MDTELPGAPPTSLESRIDAWRSYLQRSRSITASDAEELEDHLREQIASLGDLGLAPDEAFLVAVRRLGAIDALTREYAREHSDRLWKQLVLAGGEGSSVGAAPTTLWVALALAVAAGVAMKVPALFGIAVDGQPEFYALNFGLLTLPFIAAYFAWERPVPGPGRLGLAAAFGLAAVAVNAFPFPPPGPEGLLADTQLLAILHLPMALWLLVGVAYVGGRWPGSERRMDFVRFTGEAFIYYVLIALGGVVLMGVSFGLFEAIGLDLEPLVESWVVPCGVAGATVVAAWLVEAKQSVVENMAPVLARIFIPLFTLVLLAFVVTMVATGRGLDVEREVLIAVDLLLAVVFGLLLYSISARDPEAPPGILLDWIPLTLVGTALVVDVLALWAIGTRISDFGFTPNRSAALGMNVVLLVSLAGSGVLYLRFVRGTASVARLWSWQTTYLYVLAGWAAVVAFLFPLLFGFR